jgi:RNA polymerase sigma-70 factor (ECF subfamily)
VGAPVAAVAAPTVAEVRAGDDRLLTEAVDRWYGSSVRLARVLGADETTAHRAARDGWLAVIARLAELEDQTPLHVAALRSTVDEVAAKLAAEETGPAVSPDSFEDEGHGWGGWWRDEKAPKDWDQRPSDEALERALGELEPTMAAVVILRDVDRLSSEEIETVSGLAPSDQRVLLHRGRQALVDALSAAPRDDA